MRLAPIFAVIALLACGSDTSVAPAGSPRLTIVSGDGQSAEAGLTLDQPLVVHVATPQGTPMPDMEIDWAIATGGGWLSTDTSRTDAAGNASVYWTLGEPVSPQNVTASLPDYRVGIQFAAVATAAKLLPLPLQNRLVFAKGDGIVTTALDGTDLHRLSFERVAVCPALSPDNRVIAYLASPSPSPYAWSLSLMAANGTARTKLADVETYRTCPIWSSDAKHFAFEDLNAAGLSTVWVYSSDGRLETHFGIEGLVENFSPTADRLVYWRDHGNGTPLYGADVYTVGVDGAASKHLASGSRPSWAADTNLIAFECGGLCIMDGDATQVTKVVNDSYVVRPAISPNGALVAYSCSGGAVCIVSVDGSPVATVRDALPADWVQYRWSPDSKFLAYECVYVRAYNQSLRIDICRVNADGTGFRNLTNDDSAEQFPSIALP